MTEFVIGPGGTVITKKNAKKWLNEDGRDHKPEKTEQNNYSKLTTMERIKTKDFLNKHPELTTSEGRTNLFKEAIATELLRLREEDNLRKEQGKEPLTDKEKELFIPKAGVISSKWRYDQNQAFEFEATKANAAMLREIAGFGQDSR